MREQLLKLQLFLGRLCKMGDPVLLNLPSALSPDGAGWIANEWQDCPNEWQDCPNEWQDCPNAPGLVRAKLGTHEGKARRFHVCVIARLDPRASSDPGLPGCLAGALKKKSKVKCPAL